MPVDAGAPDDDGGAASPDGGETPDAGAPADDAGSDAGEPVDAGFDAGGPPEGAPIPDPRYGSFSEQPYDATNPADPPYEVGLEVHVSGETSYDPEGDAFTLSWELRGPDGASYPFEEWSRDIVNDRLEFTPWNPGTYVVTLTATETTPAALSYSRQLPIEIVLPTFTHHWDQRPPLEPRPYPRLVWDSAREVTVLVGGGDGTWEHDGTQWTRADVAYQPELIGRFPALAYDAARGVTVMYLDTDDFGQTWEYDGATWTFRSTESSPPSRGDARMVYDAVRQRVVLFGGRTTTAPLGDTWEYDGDDWEQVLTLTAPSPRSSHGMTFDSGRGVTVLLGGRGPTSNDVYNDTWEYDGTWTQRTVGGFNVDPPAAAPRALVYDPARQRTVHVGATTWDWDGSAWTEVDAAPALGDRRTATAVYDTTRDRLFLFGGFLDGEATRTEWTFNGSSWTELSVPAAPPPDAWPTTAYDETREVVVLFAGETPGSPNEGTWEWDGATWTHVITTAEPASHRGHAMVWDAAREKVVLYGGFDTNFDYDDTWEYDGTTWTLASPTASPSTRRGARLTYDSVRERVVLFGGWDDGYQNDTWEYDGTTWTQVATTSGPDLSSVGAFGSNFDIAYDPVNERVVLYGAAEGNADTVRELWFLADGEWTQSTAATPRAWDLELGWDPVSQRVVLLAGDTSYNTWDGLRDLRVWSLSPTEEWERWDMSHVPRDDTGAGFVYQTARGRFFAFGPAGPPAVWELE